MYIIFENVCATGLTGSRYENKVGHFLPTSTENIDLKQKI